MKKFFCSKTIISIFTIVLMLSVISSSVFAHEVIPGKSMRWINQKSMSYTNYLLLDVKTTNLNSSWSSAGSVAGNNWNSYSSNGTPYVWKQSTSTPNLECASCTTWFSFLPSNVVAITNIRDTYGTWFWRFDNGNTNSNIGYSINYAHIYTNPAFNNLVSANKNFVMTHEMGHVLCLGHPDSSTVSVLHTGGFPSWSNYDRPQNHDRDDLVTYYKSRLGR